METNHNKEHIGNQIDYTGLLNISVGRETQNILSNSIFLPEAKKLIELYGGKAASLLWQIQNGNERFLIPFSILPVEDQNIPEYQKKPWKEFFRGSANGDENGLVGMIESLRGSGVLDEITEIIIDGSSKRVKDYAHYFDGNSHYKGISCVIVSPYIDSHLFDTYHTFGSIIKHPDFDNHYLINTDGGRAQCLVDTDGNIVKTIGFEKSISFITPYIPQILEMKISTDQTGFIQKYTSQTEFALLGGTLKTHLNNTSGYEYMPHTQSDVIFLQQRVFRKESEKKYDIKECKYDYAHNHFGDQSIFQKGFPKIDYLQAQQYLEENASDGKIILLVTEKNYRTIKSHKESYGILRDPRVVGILISPGQAQGLGSLDHETYRLLQHNLAVKISHI